jgi:hypothetical protein
LLRIDVKETEGVATIALSGKLLAPWVPEVRRAFARESPGARPRLDLSELRYADATGVELLRGLQGDGIEIIGSNPYSRALLAR